MKKYWTLALIPLISLDAKADFSQVKDGTYRLIDEFDNVGGDHNELHTQLVTISHQGDSAYLTGEDGVRSEIKRDEFGGLLITVSEPARKGYAAEVIVYCIRNWAPSSELGHLEGPAFKIFPNGEQKGSFAINEVTGTKG